MLDEEAQLQYERFLTRYFYKVTSSVFREFIGNNFSEIISTDGRLPNLAVEIRKMATHLNKETPSAADRDNGIDWKGEITINASEIRTMPWTDDWFEQENILAEAEWTEWMPFTWISLLLVHQYNDWRIIGLVNFHSKISTRALNTRHLNSLFLKPVN